jgi:hypothetical protein
MSKELDENGKPKVVEPVAPTTEELVAKQQKELDDLIKENIKRKDAILAMERERDKFKSEVELLKTDKMKSKEMYKELAETLEKEVAELRSKDKAKDKAILNATKHAALKEAANKLGLHSTAVRYLDDKEWLDQVEVEFTSTGRVNVLNAERVAQNLKTEHPLFFLKPTAPNINTETPHVIVNDGGKVTVEQVNLLSKQYAKTRDPKDLRAYETAILQYKKQA